MSAAMPGGPAACPTASLARSLYGETCRSQT